jgi:hypothetical protein
MTRPFIAIAAAAAAAMALCLAGQTPAGATGPGLVHYTLHTNSVVVEAVDASDSPCGTEGTVSLDQRRNAVVAATVAGMSDAQVMALIQDDPDGVIRQIAVTTTGRAQFATAGHVYTGTFTSRFGGQFLPNGMYVQSGTFALQARSELGTLLRVHSGGHDVDGFDGATKMFTSHGSVAGCLP